MRLPSEPLKIHFFYIVVLLILMLLWIATWVLADDATVLSHISFAATLASLILAVLAIVYAYVSNVSFTVSLGQLSQTSTELIENADRLSEIRTELSGYLDAIHHIRASVDTQGRRLDDLLKNLPTTFAGDPQSVALSSTLLEQFLERLSIRGLLILFVLYKAYTSATVFSFEKVLKDTNTFAWRFEYLEALAYLDTFSALGLTEVTLLWKGQDPGAVPYARVAYLHQLVQEQIEKRISEMLKHAITPTDAIQREMDVQHIRMYFDAVG